VSTALANQSARVIARRTANIPKSKEQVAFLTRALEIVFGAAALVLTAPIMLGLAIIIRRGSEGPILFFQERVGRNGKPFKFVKFRTLYADARERFPELYAYQYTPDELDKLHFKVEDDPRVTPQGRWIRRTSLDELPNFWNVLTGEMALVGPRPEIPEMLVYYEGAALEKFSVRPGVTGLAQISGRGRLSFHDTVAYDLAYVRNRSWLADLRILMRTAMLIVSQDGAF